ncbi:Ribokinase-like protein [Suhomyces tanzawaensis NRRL Y-17324]|uniref:Ribokinase n=1 Tax=Suhomyces tanzawaensis NRRL Y-17324 TaxID=984487 RepID=A0A1E4SFI4_9ASCO|nr:Ribokinase-like protein [Suhomyces tanzawaensis NRRL Y-17324]ODV78273.1 Ribokinase-like protein [Suhomyces tanzawaensis NRRL Y-17324]
MKITVVGSLNYDLVTFTDRVPAAGETFQANAFENHLGGKGLNEAIAAARLLPKNSDISVRMVGNVGDDTFGKELKQALVDASVDTTHVKTIANKSSGVAVILVEKHNGENRILITGGANDDLKPTAEDYVQYFPESEPEFVMLQNEYPDTINTIDWIKTNRPAINIAYNPSPFKPERISSKTLKQIDLLILNEGEALDVAKFLLSDSELEQFQSSIETDKVQGFSDLARKLQSLINHDNVQTIVITMGAKGSIYVSKESKDVAFEPSRKIEKVVDTTGAGDTFFGGVVTKLASGKKIDEAVKYATIASSLVIQKNGAVESIPTFEQVI